MKNKFIPLDEFFDSILYDKKKGYYSKSNPFGSTGDFVTSPGISFIFSEIIAIWVISFWERIGKPKSFNIVDVNVGSSFNNTTGKFTCPVAGLYQVMYHIGFKAGHQYTETHLFLTSNDSVDYGYITQWTPDISNVGQNNGSGATVLINASANQEFAIGFDTSSGYTTPLVATSSLKEHFSFGAYLIG